MKVEKQIDREEEKKLIGRKGKNKMDRKKEKTETID